MWVLWLWWGVFDVGFVRFLMVVQWRWLGLGLFGFLIEFLMWVLWLWWGFWCGFCWLWVCWVPDGGAVVVVLWWLDLDLDLDLLIFLTKLLMWVLWFWWGFWREFFWVFDVGVMVVLYMVVLRFWCIWWWLWYSGIRWEERERENKYLFEARNSVLSLMYVYEKKLIAKLKKVELFGLIYLNIWGG